MKGSRCYTCHGKMVKVSRMPRKYTCKSPACAKKVNKKEKLNPDKLFPSIAGKKK